jgi:glyoxylase-like metal-dependent hydrolase (beta-lactamase superfamily II)
MATARPISYLYGLSEEPMLKPSTYGPITRVHMARPILGRPFYTTEAYLVDGLLIDAGCAATALELVAWCRDQDVHHVVNTHHHEDHSGGDAALQRELHLPIAAPAEAVPILADFPRLMLYRRLVWGQPRNVAVERLGSVVETEHYRFEVISTPGHCPDHVSLFEPEQAWLFSGDLYVHERVRYLRADEDALTTLKSLRRVLALRPRLLICSHAGLIDDACGAIERKIAFWEGLAEESRALRAQGLSLRQAAHRLLGPEGMMSWATWGHFSKANLIRSLVGGNWREE